MTFDAFIKIEGIPGECLDNEHKDWIEITNYDFGVRQSTSASASASGGASSGRATLSDFGFSKRLDMASSKLFEASCAGKHIAKLTLSLNRAGGDKLKYFEIELEEVIISDFSQGGGSGEPLEHIQINYGRIRTIYTLQKRAHGGAGGNITGGWDRIGNKVHG